MFSKETYTERRAELVRKIQGQGIVLLPGHTESPVNYPGNAYRFRQDSNFLYYFGLALPGLAGLIDTATGEATLFGDDFSVEDIIWMGPQPRVAELAARVGVSKTAPLADLAPSVANAVAGGRRIHILPPYRAETKIMLSGLFPGGTPEPSEELIRASQCATKNRPKRSPRSKRLAKRAMRCTRSRCGCAVPERKNTRSPVPSRASPFKRAGECRSIR